MTLGLGFLVWLARSRAGQLTGLILAALVAVWGYGAYRAHAARAAYVEAQRAATEAETARRITVLTRARESAEARVKELEARRVALDTGVAHADAQADRLKSRACLDAGSVHALDVIRRAPRR